MGTSWGRSLLAGWLSAMAFGVLTAPAMAATPPPPGANVPCQPTASHPDPVLLLHGTGGNMADTWQAMSIRLVDEGYCVYAVNYGEDRRSGTLGIYGIGEIERSAAEIAGHVDAILQDTGAAQIDIVGHSQGGMMPRYYMKHLGGGSKVDDLVGLAPSNHGTTTPLAAPSGFMCPACEQQDADSAFITALNQDDETPGTADYTTIATRYDEVVTPYTSQALTADGNEVTNIVLQDVCALDVSDHLGVPYDPIAIDLTVNALARSGPTDPAYRPFCGQL